jgi:hypothetical protein
MRRRREMAEFSLSFLDVICCGFGAVILLLMITKTVQPQIIEASTVNLEGLVADLQEQLFEIRGETRVLNRDLTARQEQLSEYEERIAILRGQLAAARSRYDSLQVETNSNAVITEQLAIAQAVPDRGDEAPARGPGGQEQPDRRYSRGQRVHHLRYRHLRLHVLLRLGAHDAEIDATLNIYPNVKGIQIMNDMGNYMFSRYRGEWIPDTDARRRVIMQNLRNWNVFSNSSPVEGITAAIRTFYDPDKKISIYVFGDEFTGQSIAEVVDTVDRINREAGDGERRVRIHAVGFPVQFIRAANQQGTGIRFATLMRELTYRNGGSFVGLNDFRP